MAIHKENVIILCSYIIINISVHIIIFIKKTMYFVHSLKNFVLRVKFFLNKFCFVHQKRVLAEIKSVQLDKQDGWPPADRVRGISA